MNRPTFGPHHVAVSRIPAGAALDVRALVADLLVEIVSDPALWDLVMDWADAVETSERPDAYAADPLRLEQILDRLRPEAHVYGAEVGQLAAALAAIARPLPMPAPVQQERRPA